MPVDLNVENGGNSMTHITNLSAEEVYQCIIKLPDIIRKRESDIIIMGRSGRTGKSALWRRLIADGYQHVREISEDIGGLVIYRDDDNHVLINEFNGDTIVVMNKIF